jgi:hypothetical protein
VSEQGRRELDPKIEALVTDFYHLRLAAGDHPLLAREYAVTLARDLYFPEADYIHVGKNKVVKRHNARKAPA